LLVLLVAVVPVFAYEGGPPPGYGGGGAQPGTGSTGDGDPPGWSQVNPGQGGTGPGQ